MTCRCVFVIVVVVFVFVFVVWPVVCSVSEIRSVMVHLLSLWFVHQCERHRGVLGSSVDHLEWSIQSSGYKTAKKFAL
uniref:AlNc14C55G4204 protein n=1 Tax=Albugo laibachii Nc14 TaxID=890382 RepID=F0WC17_9STRA|nr:AlNc14C55G4204 [Albugo laibachii Nc14]|eukprot:CCA18698.1 AlNc14C55G4204 [Albugo laibachii Nc14]